MFTIWKNVAFSVLELPCPISLSGKLEGAKLFGYLISIPRSRDLRFPFGSVYLWLVLEITGFLLLSTLPVADLLFLFLSILPGL